ncbi:RNA binding (RRM/RBD/RNP motifs) family protein [Quillaja saponaria]|uniref:RNA binding (RRM/RBD/RNP motifs) family protein n=1 Tax=Quillaja saponaria TaxID=32244 RepID=A0AAD7KXF0_QUISA|nr:RNA binding (RRM/RBD/RNP motifs) family protein [Quillaja saponaria]
MSDEGEKTCPLCAEEMDLTDQQLKPCRCGYEICVWCWHHIMDMAEKDNTEGRCPACRVPYDKEKIVGMAAKCERLVSEISMERKKNQKTKTKSSEGRKQLSSVRVVQRNLVYIVGLPLNLADEDLLQRREYFGQYGKVLKVSMSRTAAGVIQQFPNNTCSVYITYSKEDEAIRCIQNVHGFVLEGRPLRACFGTTKYCHAWLRNVPCSNPDCLYLHEIGSQEDSFTKDEIISAYTRSRVEQITGAVNNMQRRSGNVLPQPVDDYSNSFSGKPIVKNPSINSASTVRGSPPNGSSGRSITLPPATAWGTRASNCQPSPVGLASANGPTKLKPDIGSGTLAFSSAVAGTTQPCTLHGDTGKRPPLAEDSYTVHPKCKNELLDPYKQLSSIDSQIDSGEKPATSDGPPATVTLSSLLSCPQSLKDSDRGSIMTTSTMNPMNATGHSCTTGLENEGNLTTKEEVENLCSNMSSININRNVRNVTAATSVHGVYLSREQWNSSRDSEVNSQALVMTNSSTEVEEDIISFDNQRLKDPEVLCRSPYSPTSAGLLHVSNHSRPYSSQNSERHDAVNVNGDSQSVDNNISDPISSAASIISNGYPEKLVSSRTSSFDRALEHSFFLQDEGKGQHMGRLGEAANSRVDASLDRGESSIISNILSLDFDAWDDSLASPQNLAKFLGDKDEQPGPLKMSNSWKGQNNHQSRFSFAQQEDSKNKSFDVYQSLNVNERLPKNDSFIQDLAEREFFVDKLGNGNGFSSRSFEESENLDSGYAGFSSNKLSASSRAQISAPPGFSVPSRLPPPGFSSHERVDQAYDPLSGNSLLDASSLLRNSYQAPITGNIGGTGDIEFMDPAILAVEHLGCDSFSNDIFGVVSNGRVEMEMNNHDFVAFLKVMGLTHSLSFQPAGED